MLLVNICSCFAQKRGSQENWSMDNDGLYNAQRDNIGLCTVTGWGMKRSSTVTSSNPPVMKVLV